MSYHSVRECNLRGKKKVQLKAAMTADFGFTG